LSVIFKNISAVNPGPPFYRRGKDESGLEERLWDLSGGKSMERGRARRGRGED